MGRRGRPPYPDILTPREWEVLALLRENLTNEAIAARLGVTHAAAKYHVSEILSKLGVASREEAAAWEPEAAEAAREPQLRRWGLGLVGWLRPVTLGKAALIGASLVVLAGMGVLAWGTVRTAGDPQEFDLPRSYEQMLDEGSVVYLAPASQTLWIADEELVAAAEIAVVSSIEQLEEKASKEAVVVIIDREFADRVEPIWAGSLLDRGVVLVGARMNVFDIPGVVPFDVPGVPWPDDSARYGFDQYDESRIFYTLYERRTCGAGAGSGGAQDILDQRPVDDFRRFLATLARHYADAQCRAAVQS